MYINGPGHMTKMATMPIYGKNLQKTFSYRTNSHMIMKLGTEHYELKLYTVYDPGVDLDLFYNNVKFVKTCFCSNGMSRYQVSVYRTIGPLVYL